MSMNSSSKFKLWKLLAYLGCIGILAVYCVFANDIVYAFKSEDTDLHSYEGLESCQTTTNGYAAVEVSDYYAGDMETLWLYGWAYAESNGNTLPVDGKETYILFKGDLGKVYRAKAVVSIRPDIYYAQSDLGRKPISGNVGYEARMSTLTLKNGTYDLYFYVYENEEMMSLISTDLAIIKTDTEVRFNDKSTFDK